MLLAIASFGMDLYPVTSGIDEVIRKKIENLPDFHTVDRNYNIYSIPSTTWTISWISRVIPLSRKKPTLTLF